MNEDVIQIEVTEDGIVKSTTPRISAANHANSAEFFRHLARLTGGEQTATKRNKALEGHHHTHEHTKEGQ